MNLRCLSTRPSRKYLSVFSVCSERYEEETVLYGHMLIVWRDTSAEYTMGNTSRVMKNETISDVKPLD